MAVGATSTTDYAKEYKRGEWIEREGSPEEVAEALLSELEAEFAKIEIPQRESICVGAEIWSYLCCCVLRKPL
jgi:hypothetical protein